MSELPPQVASWLYNVLQSQYTNKQLAYTDVYKFLRVYLNKNLKFKIRTSVYTSSITGHSNLLINLFGSIKVNEDIIVPVTIWIPLNYPYHFSNTLSDDIGVPIVYITPDNSQSWYLKPGNHVDSQGRFYHPYLSNWYHEYNTQPQNYNLLELISILYNLFIKDTPIFQELGNYIPPTHFDSHNSPVPAKPAKIPINSKVSTPSKDNVNETVNLAENTDLSRVPLKYQSPLPLPNEVLSLNRNIEAPHANEYNSIRFQKKNQPQEHVQEPQPQPVPYLHQTFNHNRDSNRAKHAQKNETVNLMDKDDQLNNDINKNQDFRRALHLLSDQINNHLSISSNCSINKELSKVNTNSMKIDALFQQLSHHNQQALANSENLDNHIIHIKKQLSNLTNLNRELIQLEDLNTQQSDKVSINSSTTFDLDDLIIPDLVLVNQLYETISEIKATKDTINLISGTFQSESELINNTRMDACVKSVRGLGRELFWLEAMKREIASNTMRLNT